MSSPANTRCKLVLFTNRKSHTNFRLLPKWVTLNDPERRNRPPTRATSAVAEQVLVRQWAVAELYSCSSPGKMYDVNRCVSWSASGWRGYCASSGPAANSALKSSDVNIKFVSWSRSCRRRPVSSPTSRTSTIRSRSAHDSRLYARTSRSRRPPRTAVRRITLLPLILFSS